MIVVIVCRINRTRSRAVDAGTTHSNPISHPRTQFRNDEPGTQMERSSPLTGKSLESLQNLRLIRSQEYRSRLFGAGVRPIQGRERVGRHRE